MSPGRMRCIAVLALIFAGAGGAPFASPKDQAPKVPEGPSGQVQFQIVHAFGAAGDGVAPGDGVVMDSKGNLYGTTEGGGAFNGGTVYEMTPGANGQWTETILYNFPDGPPDGSEPNGVVMDGAGNLYGVTEFGGDGQYCGDTSGCGTIFELSPGSGGVWTESILYNFCSLAYCADGAFPIFPPTLGPGGVLYGIGGGVYELAPGSGGWTFSIIYTLCSQPGCEFTSSLTLDAKGNLYGEGGNGQKMGQCRAEFGCGIVFALHPQSDGKWNEIVLYEFENNSADDGISPEGGLTFHDGGLYGVTNAGGSDCVNVGGCGTVFQLTRGSVKNVNEQVPWSFGANAAQGLNPGTWVVFDRRGDFFGVTGIGGEGCGGIGCGVVYGMRQQTNGKWKYAVLHTFDGSDGVEPDSGLTMDSKGNLFGTTGGGGQYGYGVLYEISPTTQASK